MILPGVAPIQGTDYLPQGPRSHRKTRIRRFLVSFDNGKRLRARFSEYQKFQAEGVVFSSHHVILDTQEIKPDYRSLSVMEETLAAYGNYQITWIDDDDDS